MTDAPVEAPRRAREGRASSLIGAIVAASTRNAWAVIAVAVVIGGAAWIYLQRNFAIDTNSANLISEDLPWRKREAAFAAAFPQRDDLIAIVVDAATPELAEAATASLRERLASHGELFRTVWRPDGGAFFDRSGLLFESTAEVQQTTRQLIAAQPLLGTLAADPSLRGVMQSLSLVLRGAERDSRALDAFVPAMTRFSTAFEMIAAGKTPAFSWRSLINAREPGPRELRRFILIHPVLDYTQLQPGGAATDGIRRAIHELSLDNDERIRVRLTGNVPLADEEFETLVRTAPRSMGWSRPAPC